MSMNSRQIEEMGNRLTDEIEAHIGNVDRILANLDDNMECDKKVEELERASQYIDFVEKAASELYSRLYIMITTIEDESMPDKYDLVAKYGEDAVIKLWNKYNDCFDQHEIEYNLLEVIRPIIDDGDLYRICSIIKDRPDYLTRNFNYYKRDYDSCVINACNDLCDFEIEYMIEYFKYNKVDIEAELKDMGLI